VSDQTIIEYSSFNIAAGETVNFIAPSLDSFSLNRVIGGSASEIFGTLSANGNIIFVNTNGIYFAPTADVGVGGLMASTRDISNADFLAGAYRFENFNADMQNQLAEVFNEGRIQTREGGFAVLIGSAVANNGVIVAPLGTVALAAGELVTVGINGSNQISIGIDRATAAKVLGRDGQEVLDQITQSGQIEAQGGRVIMKAEAARELFRQAVNQTGYVRADTLVNNNGIIEITASGDIHTAGTLQSEDGLIQIQSDASVLLEDNLKAADGQVIVEATQDIKIINPLVIEGDTRMAADNNIEVNANITATGDLVLAADADLNGEGSFIQASGTTIAATGDIEISSSGESWLANITAGGDLALKKAGADVVYNQHTGSQVHVAGTLSINEGVTLSAVNTQFEVGQDWLNFGYFDAGLSIVGCL